MKPYEALFILSESVRDDRVEDVVARLRREVEKLGGTVDRTLDVGRRGFAMPLKKREAGHYLRVDLSLEPSAVAPLLARLRLVEDIFRLQIVAAPKPSAFAVAAEGGEAAAPAPAQAESGHGVA